MSLHVLSKRALRVREWLRDSVLACAADGYPEFLESRGYTALVITNYVGAVAHFAHWLTRTGRCVQDTDEALIHRFIDRHTPVCRCVRPCLHRRRDLRLGLILLLQWLREERMIATPVLPPRPPLVAELDEFESHLLGVCGLAASTRCQYLSIVRHFLSACFGSQPIEIARLTSHNVRNFIKRHYDHWRPCSLRIFGVALRGYLRFKALAGAVVEPLGRVVPRLPHWALESLPRTLTRTEIKRLLKAMLRVAGDAERARRCVGHSWNMLVRPYKQAFDMA